MSCNKCHGEREDVMRHACLDGLNAFAMDMSDRIAKLEARHPGWSEPPAEQPASAADECGVSASEEHSARVYLKRIFPDGCDAEGCCIPGCLASGCPGPSAENLDQTQLEGYEPPAQGAPATNAYRRTWMTGGDGTHEENRCNRHPDVFIRRTETRHQGGVVIPELPCEECTRESREAQGATAEPLSEFDMEHAPMSAADRIRAAGRAYRAGAKVFGWDGLADEVSAIEARLAAAERERDHWRQARENALKAGELLLKERDEARADADHWEQRHKDQRRAIVMSERERDEALVSVKQAVAAERERRK
jgi:hypothetical protein